jgi:hypothetical protein
VKGNEARGALMCQCGHPRRDHDTADNGECLHGVIVCECMEFVQGESCVEVLVDGVGVRMTFDREPTDEDLTLAASIVRAARKLDLVSEEQAERQRLARARIHSRNLRVRGER